MIRIRTLLLLCLVPTGIMAQRTVVLQGSIVDGATNLALSGVHISLAGTESGAVSTSDGSFRIALPQDRSSQLDLSLVGYAPLSRVIGSTEALSGATLLLKMDRKAVELMGVTIERPGPEVIYLREDLHVGDHHVNDQGIWVLTYERPQLWHPEAEAGRQVFREARVHLLDTLFVEQCSIRIPGEVVRLHHDHAGRPIVEGTGRAWSIALANGELSATPFELTVLRSEVLPWTANIAGSLLGSNYSATYPAFDHIIFDPATGSSRPICAVQDERSMELFRSQFKYMSGRDKVIAMDLEIETGIEREVIAGYMTGFYNDPYYSAPYAPLFVVRDTICIFDHCAERIMRFDSDLVPCGESGIVHHKDRTWRDRLIQDPVDGTVYALFAKGKDMSLRSVDPMTGALGRARTLTHPYPEVVQVHDGHVYYVFRPFGSLQRRTLYREAIK